MDFKKVLINIYCSESLKITEIDEEAGLRCLARAMGPQADKVPEERRVYPREDDSDYKKDVFFVYDNVGYY